MSLIREEIYRAYAYGNLTPDQLKERLQKVDECDCDILKPIHNGHDVNEYFCEDCHKSWFGCAWCKHPVDFESQEEVLEHVAERHQQEQTS